MKRKTVIFDFDGVLCNSKKMAINICKSIKKDITKEEFESLFDGNFTKNLRIGFRLIFDKSFRREENEFYSKTKIKDETIKIIQKLYKNYNLFIVTSNTIENVELFCKNNNFYDKFIEALTREDGLSKARKFSGLLKKYNISRDECVFITDTLGDIKAANKAKLKTIGCTFGYQGIEKIKQGNPVKIISKFKQIPQTIKKII